MEEKNPVPAPAPAIKSEAPKEPEAGLPSFATPEAPKASAPKPEASKAAPKAPKPEAKKAKAKVAKKAKKVASKAKASPGVKATRAIVRKKGPTAAVLQPQTLRACATARKGGMAWCAIEKKYNLRPANGMTAYHAVERWQKVAKAMVKSQKKASQQAMASH